jgi:hypothetical protein
VSTSLDHPHLASIAVGGDGAVYVAGIDAKHGVWATRSTDAGRTFAAPTAVARLTANPAGDCSLAAQSPLPRETTVCTGPNPTVAVGRKGVYIVYGDIGANGSQDVLVRGLDPSLDPAFHGQVNPPEPTKTAQFFPTAAVDPATGVLWACWYDTTFDPNAHRAWFTCSASNDGRAWGVPQRASAEPTAPDELYAVGGRQGLAPAVVADGGVAHAFWIDGRVVPNEFDVFTAALRQAGALRPAG